MTVPEHRAEQFLALSRQVLAVWEYRDRFGERGIPGRGPRRSGRGRHGRHPAAGRCGRRETTVSDESVASA